MNPFSEKYKLSSTTDLLKIMSDPDNYQPLAVEAATLEIANRQLTDIELNDAKAEVESQKQEYSTKIQKKREIENNLKRNIINFLHSINPIEKSTPTKDKLIKLICIVFGVIAIFKMYKGFSYIASLFTYNSGYWDVWTVWFFTPLILLPIAIVLFWQRKKIGWIFLAIFLTYSTINIIALIYSIFSYKSSGYPIIDDLFPRPSLTGPILSFVFFGGVLFTICKKNIREKFGVNIIHLIASIGITAALMGVIIFLYN